VKRFSVRNMVEAGAMNDLKAACVYDGETVTVTVVFFCCRGARLDRCFVAFQCMPFPSCTPRITIAFHALSTSTSSACATVRSAATVNPPSDSAAYASFPPCYSGPDTD
jgi:hypothetical protein